MPVQPGSPLWRYFHRKPQAPVWRTQEAPYITGLAGGGRGYFTDQYGNPRMVLGDAVWALAGNAGRWNGGDWKADLDAFIATRAAQGFTVLYGKPMGTLQSSNIDDNGQATGGLFPFQGGAPTTGTAAANPSTGLTEPFWQRIDYLLTSARRAGITLFMNAIGYSSDFDSGPGPLAGKSTAEFQSYGTQLGNRYKNTPNLVWMVADDYFSDADSLIAAFLTGLQAAGDQHAIAIENMPESSSRNTFDVPPTVLPWGTGNALFNFVYSYNQAYYGVEEAYKEPSPIPVIQGDGYFAQGNNVYSGGSGAFAFDQAFRQDAWWALASGARGKVLGSESIWQWQSTALSSAQTDWFYVNNAKTLRTVVESLPGWQNLLPDLTGRLVTGGRGTRASAFASGGGGGQYEVAFTSSYVAASMTPDHTLALLYLPRATTITIDTRQLGPGFTATWIDPVTGATSSAGTGATYNSTAKGNNSQGDPDWVLVFQGPFVSTAGVPPAQPGSPLWRKRYHRVQGITADPQPAAAPPQTPVVPLFTSAVAGEDVDRSRQRPSGFATVVMPPVAAATVPVPQFTRAQPPPQHQPQRRPAFIPAPVIKPPAAPWTRARRMHAARVPRVQPQQMGSPPKALVFPVLAQRAPPARARSRGGFSRVPFVPAAAAVTPVVPPWTDTRPKPGRPGRGEFTGPLSPGAARPAPPSWLSGWTRAVRRHRTTVAPAQGFRRTPSPVTPVTTPVLSPFTRAVRVMSSRAGLRRTQAVVVRVAPVTPAPVAAERLAPRLPRARGFSRVHLPAAVVPQVPALTRALRVTRSAVRRTLRALPLGKGANPPAPPAWLGQRVTAARTHPRPPRRAAGFVHGHQPPPPQSSQLTGVWAGAPHGQWAAGEPHGSYASGEPHGQWTAGEPHP